MITLAHGTAALLALFRTRLLRTHPFAPDARQRPGKTPVRTALSPRYLIRMRPLVQVQPGPLHRVELRKHSSKPLSIAVPTERRMRTAVSEHPCTGHLDLPEAGGAGGPPLPRGQLRWD